MEDVSRAGQDDSLFLGLDALVTSPKKTAGVASRRAGHLHASLAPALVFDGGNGVKIEATNRERTNWAVRSGAGCCLNRDLSWQVEPMPSHRSDDFLAHCRWPSAEEAYAALLEYRASAAEETQP